MLHDVAYRDPDQGGRRRPVLHRGSIAEMAVPYAGEGKGLGGCPRVGVLHWVCVCLSQTVPGQSVVVDGNND